MHVISTIGPASATPEFVRHAIDLGQPYFRLNGSHLTQDELRRHVDLIRQAAATARTEIVLDLQGGKRRIGALAQPLTLTKGDLVALSAGAAGPPHVPCIPLSERALQDAMAEGDRVVLQDRDATLVVRERQRGFVLAQSESDCCLRSHCGVHVEGKALAHNALPPAQQEQIALAAELGIDGLALSFVCTAQELGDLREQALVYHSRPCIIAKLERPEVFARLCEIDAAADELWFCRGDLGSLSPLRTLGALQRQAFDVATQNATPLVIAGQVFHHLTTHSAPTRSEVVHFWEIQQQGACGIVLSDETALGHDPKNALRQVCDLVVV